MCVSSGGRGFHPAHLVDQAGIVRRQPGDLGLDAALGQAAAQPLDQPGPEGVELGDLRDVDEDIGPAAASAFRRRPPSARAPAQSGRSTNPRRTAQVRCPAQSAPMSGRRSRCQLLCHRMLSRFFADVMRGEPGKFQHAADCLVEHVPNQPYLVAPGKLYGSEIARF